MDVRLYAVLRIPHRRRVALPRGLGSEVIRIITCGGVSAAVADISRPVEASPRNLFAFARIVRELAGLSDAILPARFGATADSVATLRSAIVSQAPALTAALECVAGRVQMTVRFPKQTTSK